MLNHADIYRCSVVSAVRSKEERFTSHLQEIYRVENDLSTWWQRVPSDMKSEVTGVPIVEKRDLPKILLVNLVYRQSLCALHSSIVPLFCWSKGDGTYSSARQVSAQIAFEHSCSISNLIKFVLATDCPISAMPLFVAYAAYSSCAIQIPFLWCSEASIKERARGNIEVNIDMIQQMSSYWKLASLLVISLLIESLQWNKLIWSVASLCSVPSQYTQTQSTDNLQRTQVYRWVCIL